MSVKVQDLTKIYQGQAVVDRLTFQAGKGEILGFLGPNGAGKTTTMKILSGYLFPDAGDAWVEGHHILESPDEVKKCVGYLAENNPLYTEMYVREFLEFMARFYRIENPQARIREVIEQTGLGPMSHKLIGTLSKGYKQRVGLAHAILHNPKVLILDEPTSGLDVNQLSEIRSLILELSKDKTVIFSSHIMQEIEALCNRVLIIHQGKCVANEPIENLAGKMAGSQSILLELEQENINPAIFSQLHGIQHVSVSGVLVKIEAAEKKDIRKEVFQQAVKNNLTILEMKKEQMQFEEIFKSLTNT